MTWFNYFLSSTWELFELKNMDVNIRFEGKTVKGNTVSGYLLTNKLATYIATEKNPHECTQYGFIEIDQYQRVMSETVRMLNETL